MNGDLARGNVNGFCRHYGEGAEAASCGTAWAVARQMSDVSTRKPEGVLMIWYRATLCKELFLGHRLAQGGEET